MSNRFQIPTGTISGLPSFEFVCKLTPEQIARVQGADGLRPNEDFAVRLNGIVETAARTILFPSPRGPADPFRRFAAAADRLAKEVTIGEYGIAAASAARRMQEDTRKAAERLARRPGQPVNEARKTFFRETVKLGIDCGLDLRFQSGNTNHDGWVEEPTPIFLFVKAAIGVVVETIEEAVKVAGAAVGNDVARRLADWRIADATLLNHLRKVDRDANIHSPSGLETR